MQAYNGQFGTFGVNAYASVGVETQVNSASPHKLVTLMYDATIAAIKRAEVHMQQGSTAEKGKAISQAQRIINEGLRVSLDFEAGGQIAANLENLYEYIGRRLFEANANNDTAPLHEAIRLLDDLRGAWKDIENAI